MTKSYISVLHGLLKHVTLTRCVIVYGYTHNISLLVIYTYVQLTLVIRGVPYPHMEMEHVFRPLYISYTCSIKGWARPLHLF